MWYCLYLSSKDQHCVQKSCWLNFMLWFFVFFKEINLFFTLRYYNKWLFFSVIHTKSNSTLKLRCCAVTNGQSHIVAETVLLFQWRFSALLPPPPYGKRFPLQPSAAHCAHHQAWGVLLHQGWQHSHQCCWRLDLWALWHGETLMQWGDSRHVLRAIWLQVLQKLDGSGHLRHGESCYHVLSALWL